MDVPLPTCAPLPSSHAVVMGAVPPAPTVGVALPPAAIVAPCGCAAIDAGVHEDGGETTTGSVVALPQLPVIVQTYVVGVAGTVIVSDGESPPAGTPPAVQE